MILKKKKLNTNKELRATNNLPTESVEASLEEFDMSLNNIWLEYRNFLDKTVTAVLQVINDVS